MFFENNNKKRRKKIKSNKLKRNLKGNQKPEKEKNK